MQIDNRHSRRFHTQRRRGAHVCPRGFICQTRRSVFSKGVKSEGVCKNGREKAELKRNRFPRWDCFDASGVIVLHVIVCGLGNAVPEVQPD